MNQISSARLLLLDNTVLSNFASVARLDVLIQALEGRRRLATTPQVIGEFNEGVVRGRLPKSDLGWLEITNLDNNEEVLFQELSRRVNAGEAACLSVAAHRGGHILTDDRDARKLAAQFKIPVSGTLGVLFRSVRIQTLTLNTANDILAQMVSHGYRSPIKNLETL